MIGIIAKILEINATTYNKEPHLTLNLLCTVMNDMPLASSENESRSRSTSTYIADFPPHMDFV